MAASRVNIKFVIILVSVLVLGFVGMAGAFFFVIKRSPEQNAALGDKKFAEGQYKAAEVLYSKAVFKDQTNAEYLSKWKKALEQLKPETISEFNTEYGNYLNLVRQLAVVQKTNVAAHREYLDNYSRSISMSAFDLAANQRLLSEAEDALKYFEEVPTTQDNWEVLRRYRGQTLVRMMAEAPQQVDEKRRDLALADCQAALKADPADAETALALEDWYHIRALEERKGQRTLEADKLEAQADRVAEEFLAANPNNMAGHLSRIRRKMETFRLKAVEELKVSISLETKTRINRELRAQLDTMIPQLDELGSVLNAKDPSQINLLELLRLQMLESALDPTARLRRTEQVLNTRLKAVPDDYYSTMLLGVVLNARQDFKGAIAQFQKVVDAPQKPVSFDGAQLFHQKTDAANQITLAQMKVWALAPEPEREAELKKAKDYRQKLALNVAEESRELKLVDAQLAYAQRDYPTAQRLITSYNQDTGNSNPDALWLLTQCAMKLEQPGLAQTTLSRLLEMRPDFYDGMIMQADLLLKFEQRQQALDMYKAALAINPSEALQKRVAILEGVIKGGSTGDPVIDAVTQAEREAQGNDKENILPNPERAMATLVAAYEQYGDSRLIKPIAIKKLEANDRDGALVFIRRGLQKEPDNMDLKELEIVFSKTDPLEAKLAYVELLKPPPLERALNLFHIYRTHDKKEEAAAQLAEAVKLSPQDPRVIEMQFIDALQKKDIAKARQLADQAVAANADREHGLTFRARVAVLEDRLPEGISMLQQATSGGSANVETWRLLGALQTQAGRMADAATSYKRAVDLRPNDSAAVYEFVLSLAQAGQSDDALRMARDYDRFGAGDERFVELRLILESTVASGDKKWAVKRREQLAVAKPDDYRNKLYLASLYMDERFMPKARGLIDEARAKNDSLEWANLDARWYADQGNAAGMQKVVQDYLAKIPADKLNSTPYIGFGQFFITRGLAKEGFAIMEEGRPRQDTKLMEVDRAIADNYARLERQDEAIAAYRRVVEAGADDKDFVYTKRLAELLLLTGKNEEAHKLLLGLGKRVDEDPITMMLYADALRGLGNDAAKAGKTAEAQSYAQKAHDTYDKSVQVFPSEALVYMKRAQVNSDRPEMVQPVLADLDAALKLKPGSWQALKLRAGQFIKLNRFEDAITDLRDAIKYNPSLDEIRFMLMAELIRRGRAVEADELAKDALRRRTNDLNLLIGFGDIFRGESQMDRAEGYYKTAWELNKTPQITLRLLEAQLNRDNPNVTGAADVLKDIQAQVDKDPALLMSRAKLLAKRGQMDAGLNDALSAVKLISADRPEFILAWYSDLRRVQSNPPDLLRFLDNAAKAGVHPEWCSFFRAGLMCDDANARAQGLELLNQLIERGQDKNMQLLACRLRGSTLYNAAEYQKAADAYKAGLVKFPGDWEINNNLAYTMAFHLNQAAEGLPYSEAAVKIVPDNGDAQDTLGFCLMKTGKLGPAEEAFKKAITNARSARSRLSALLHLAEVYVLQKRGGDAETVAQQVGDMIKADQNLGTYSNDLDDLRRRISSLGH